MNTSKQSIWLVAVMALVFGLSTASLGDTFNFHFDKKPGASTGEDEEQGDEGEAETGAAEPVKKAEIEGADKEASSQATNPVLPPAVEAPNSEADSIQTRAGQTPIIINNTNNNPNTNQNTITLPLSQAAPLPAGVPQWARPKASDS